VSSAQAEGQVVVFSLLGERYAVPIGTVREIIRYVRPGATATASRLIRGMINLRDRVVPIVDLSPALDGELGAAGREAGGNLILILEVPGVMFGVIVDAVDGIRLLPADRIEPLPAAASQELGTGIAAIDDRLIVLLDPERIAVSAGLATKRPTRRRTTRGSRESAH